MQSNTIYTTQESNSSIESNDSEPVPSDNVVRYGPIQVRLCRKKIPTIATGRRSKSLILVGDEAMRRERRREKNREAARKLKEKRQLIEEELSQKLNELEDEHSKLQNYLTQLREQKLRLQEEINKLLSVAIDELVSNDHLGMLSSRQYTIEFDLFDESIERILNFDLNASFTSVINN